MHLFNLLISIFANKPFYYKYNKLDIISIKITIVYTVVKM